MKDLNKLRELSGLPAATNTPKKLDEGTMGGFAEIPTMVAHREETDMDRWARVVSDAENGSSGGLFEAAVEAPGDLQNGYGKHHTANGDDYFPDGADSPVVKNTGPASAKQGDNPMQKAMKDNQKDEIHEALVHAYRSHLSE